MIAEEIPNDLIKPSEAARLVGVKPDTVYGWVQRGRLRGWKLDTGMLRVSRADVLGLLKPVTRVRVSQPVPMSKARQKELEDLRRRVGPL